jgi:tRNA-dihydrouridine synthase
MEGVTDTVFRQIVAGIGPPHLYVTEFANVDLLMTRGRTAVSRRFVQTERDQPLIAQLWGLTPEHFHTVARHLADGDYGQFVGIDLNMGCPDKSIVRRGACAGLINHPEQAIEIIQATQAGAGHLPVSVKTRCGVADWVTEEWAGRLLTQNLAALTIHGRIARERSSVPARWEEIARVVAVRDALGKATAIIGNGDVASYADGLAKVRATGVDGVMVGRGIFQNLWFFDPARDPATVSLPERLALLERHIELWQATWAGQKNFDSLKRFYKSYFAGIPEAADLQQALMRRHTPDETLACIRAALRPGEQRASG